MFRSAQQTEAAEIAAAENWRLFHKRKRLVTVPAKLIGAAAVLSFAYFSGEAAGVRICAPVVMKESSL